MHFCSRSISSKSEWADQHIRKKTVCILLFHGSKLLKIYDNLTPKQTKFTKTIDKPRFWNSKDKFSMVN